MDFSKNNTFSYSVISFEKSSVTLQREERLIFLKFESIFMRQKVKRQLILVLEFNKSFWIIYFVTYVSCVRPSFRGEQDRVLIG